MLLHYQTCRMIRRLILGVENTMATWSASKPRFLIPVKPYQRETPHYPSISSGEIQATTKVKPKYKGEMAERERKAQQEIAFKRSCVAPAYNKGGYQYITPETDPKTIGRK